MTGNRGLLSLSVGIVGAWIFAVLVVFLAETTHVAITRELLVDTILIANMISAAISLFAFSRYVVMKDRLLQFIAFAFLVGGFIRVVGITISDLGILSDHQMAFYFQIAAWQGGRFLFALMLCVGTLLVWVYPELKSSVLDILVEVAVIIILLSVSIFVLHTFGVKGNFISAQNSRVLAFTVSGFFLVSFIGVSRNYLKYPTLFNYSISITLFLLMIAALVGSFSHSFTDTASAAHIALSLSAFTIGAVGSLVDVGQIFGEYVRNSEGLKAANQELLKYQFYLEQLPDPVRIVDEHGSTVYVNPSFERDFGFSISEMMRKEVFELYQPDERETVEEYEQLVDNGTQREFELTVVTKDGRSISSLLNSVPIIIEGKRLGRITVYRDITKRKELEYRDQVLSAAVENTTQAVIVTDHQAKITFMNSAAEKLFGYAMKEIPGGTLSGIITSPAASFGKPSDIFRQTVESGGWTGEVINRHRDGSEYFVSLNMGLIKNAEGRLTAAVGICEDITEKKWEERRKEAAYHIAQLSVSSRRTSDFVKSASDLILGILSTPIAVLYMYDEANAKLELAAVSSSIGRRLNFSPPQIMDLDSPQNPSNDGEAVKAAKTCKTVFSPALSRTEFAAFESEPLYRGAGLVSLPLVSSGDMVGVLQFITAKKSGSMEYETSLAEVAGVELATGIQKLKLATKIAEQAEQLEKIFASASEGIAVVDGRGKIVLMNEAGKEILGLKDIPAAEFHEYASAFGMRKLNGILLSENENPIRQAAVQGKNVRNYQFIAVTEGGERVLSISAAPLIGASQDAIGAVAIFSDVTEQKKNEIEINRQNRRLSVINRTALGVKDALDVDEIFNKGLSRVLESEDISGAAVYLLDEETSTMNLAASLGFTTSFESDDRINHIPAKSGIMSEVIDAGEAVLIPEVSVEERTDVLFEVLESELVISAAFVPIIGTRKLHGVLLLTSESEKDFGKTDEEFVTMISRVIGAAVENALLYSDVLEKSKELEDSNEQLTMSKLWVEEANAQLVRANQQLEEASRLKSQFLANMSHELRTPLNSIIGFTNLILTDDLQPPTGEQKEGLEIVLRNAKNLLALINDILDLSKIEAGKLTISPEEFAIDEVVKDALITVEPLVGSKPVKLLSEGDPQIPVIYSDSARIKQIILNLLSNAAKFTEQGHIKVATKLVEENFLSLSVEDTGSGIPVDYLDLVFEEFRQVDGSNTRKHGGTGLGLAISRKLARMLGGDLTVQSEMRKGSTFTLTVPLQFRREKSNVDEEVAPPPPPTPSSQMNNLVICIDDDPDVLVLLKNHLESEGFEFLGISDSRTAIDTVRQSKPILITLDIMMPNKDGWVILQELKSDPQLKEIPVIIHSVVDNKALAVSLGAESYLVKPVDSKQIVSVIRSYTGTVGGEILVIDDNEDFTNFLRSLLEKSSFTIHTARNGIEAMDILSKTVPSLVFLDLLMPEMDGFEVASLMYEDERLRGVPIVVLTAKEVTEQDRTALNSKIKNIVRKEGLTREIILREVNKFIQRKN